MESLWMGKPLSSYSKDELIEIINKLGEMDRIFREDRLRERLFWRDICRVDSREGYVR